MIMLKKYFIDNNVRPETLSVYLIHNDFLAARQIPIHVQHILFHVHHVFFVSLKSKSSILSGYTVISKLM